MYTGMFSVGSRRIINYNSGYSPYNMTYMIRFWWCWGREGLDGSPGQRAGIWSCDHRLKREGVSWHAISIVSWILSLLIALIMGLWHCYELNHPFFVDKQYFFFWYQQIFCIRPLIDHFVHFGTEWLLFLRGLSLFKHAPFPCAALAGWMTRVVSLCACSSTWACIPMSTSSRSQWRTPWKSSGSSWRR